MRTELSHTEKLNTFVLEGDSDADRQSLILINKRCRHKRKRSGKKRQQGRKKDKQRERRTAKQVDRQTDTEKNTKGGKKDRKEKKQTGRQIYKDSQTGKEKEENRTVQMLLIKSVQKSLYKHQRK